MITIHFEMALLIAIAPAIITSLIDGLGEWSNSKNFKELRALDAIRSFRSHVELKINDPSNNYIINLRTLNNNELQKLVMFSNQWSVYISSHIASKKIVYKAISYELSVVLTALLPTAHQLKFHRNIEGYYYLIKQIKHDDL